MSDHHHTVLLLPGWQNSGPGHWQSRWETLYGYQRVEQHDWMRPLRGDWMAQLESAVLASAAPVVLVAHSLGCHLVAAWAAHSRHTARVRAALLVAPGDPEVDALQGVLASWRAVVWQALPFSSLLLGSRNDPYCSLQRAHEYAQAWGAQWLDYGARGHINADSGLGDWPEGHALLQQLRGTGPAGGPGIAEPGQTAPMADKNADAVRAEPVEAHRSPSTSSGRTGPTRGERVHSNANGPDPGQMAPATVELCGPKK